MTKLLGGRHFWFKLVESRLFCSIHLSEAVWKQQQKATNGEENAISDERRADHNPALGLWRRADNGGGIWTKLQEGTKSFCSPWAGGRILQKYFSTLWALPNPSKAWSMHTGRESRWNACDSLEFRWTGWRGSKTIGKKQDVKVAGERRMGNDQPYGCMGSNFLSHKSKRLTQGDTEELWHSWVFTLNLHTKSIA